MKGARAGGSVALLLVAALAAANGSMGLALEMFANEPWLVYVAVTVVFEAWMIGGWLRLHWLACIGLSLLANFVTAMCCPMFATPLLHEAHIGGPVNPSPLLTVVVWLVFFGLVSAFVEGQVWDWAARASRKARAERPFRRSILTHMLGVPIALAILLVAPHPYEGLGGTMGARTRVLREALNQTVRVSEDGDTITIPNVRTVSELIELAQNTPGRLGSRWQAPGGAWAAAYVPDYGRFAIGENRRHPVEWNTAVSGKTFKLESGKGPWVIRHRTPDGSVGGFFLNLSPTEFGPDRIQKLLQFSKDPVKLGFAP